MSLPNKFKLPRKRGLSIQRILEILSDYEDLCDLFCASDIHLRNGIQEIVANNEQWYANRPEITTNVYDLRCESDLEYIMSLISEFNTELMRKNERHS